MSPKKKESALGKGLDALIRREYLNEEEEKSRIKNEKSEDIPTEPDQETGNVQLEPSSVEISSKPPKSPVRDVDAKIIDAVLLEVHKNPRISLWSARSAAVLRFLKKTRPEFSISNEASLLIEEAVKDRHPDIWKIFEEKGL